MDNRFLEFLEEYQKYVIGQFIIPEEILKEEKDKKKIKKVSRFELMDI